MPDTLDRAAQERRWRWTRTHTIWTLIVLSLLPGAVVVLFREEWTAMPAGFRGAIYLISAILIVAVFVLIVTAGGSSPRGDSTS